MLFAPGFRVLSRTGAVLAEASLAGPRNQLPDGDATPRTKDFWCSTFFVALTNVKAAWDCSKLKRATAMSGARTTHAKTCHSSTGFLSWQLEPQALNGRRLRMLWC